MWMGLAQWLNKDPGRGPGVAFALGALIFIVNTRLLTRIGLQLLPQWIWFLTILGIVAVNGGIAAEPSFKVRAPAAVV